MTWWCYPKGKTIQKEIVLYTRPWSIESGKICTNFEHPKHLKPQFFEYFINFALAVEIISAVTSFCGSEPELSQNCEILSHQHKAYSLNTAADKKNKKKKYFTCAVTGRQHGQIPGNAVLLLALWEMFLGGGGKLMFFNLSQCSLLSTSDFLSWLF